MPAFSQNQVEIRVHSVYLKRLMNLHSQGCEKSHQNFMKGESVFGSFYALRTEADIHKSNQAPNSPKCTVQSIHTGVMSPSHLSSQEPN